MAAQPEIRNVEGEDALMAEAVVAEAVVAEAVVAEAARATRGSHCCGRAVPRREWLTIHEASELIGVSPATLRRWSDAGDIKAFTTPGGHRRFARAAVLGLIPTDRRERTGSRLGDIAERVARAYRRLGTNGNGSSTGAASMAGTRSLSPASVTVPGSVGSLWLAQIGETEIAPFRELAGAMAAALLDLLEAGPDARESALAHAEASAAAFGAMAAARGATIAEAIDAFLGLRKPFLRELTSGACRQGFDARQTTDMLDSATEAIDHLITALVRGHQAGIEPRPMAVVSVVGAGAPAV